MLSPIGIAAAVSVFVWAGVMALVALAWTDDRRRTHQEEYDDWRLARYGARRRARGRCARVDVPGAEPVAVPVDVPQVTVGRWDQLVTTIRLEEAGANRHYRRVGVRPADAEPACRSVTTSHRAAEGSVRSSAHHADCRRETTRTVAAEPPILEPVIELREIRRLTTAFLERGAGTIGGLFHLIWGIERERLRRPTQPGAA